MGTLVTAAEDVEMIGGGFFGRFQLRGEKLWYSSLEMKEI